MGSVLCSQLNKMLFERHVLPSTIFKETVDLRLLVGYKIFFVLHSHSDNLLQAAHCNNNNCLASYVP